MNKKLLDKHTREKCVSNISEKAFEKEVEQEERYIPLVKWPDYHPWPSVAGLRYLVQNAHRNGFCSVIIKAGSRVILKEKAFFSWLEERNGKPLRDDEV